MYTLNQARSCLILLVALGCARTPLGVAGGAGGNAISKSGGAMGTGGTGGSSGAGGATRLGGWGGPCTRDQDCAADGICCDGSTPSCDVTRLPTGDSNNPGELVYSADNLTASDTITGLTWQRGASGKRPGCSDGNGGCTWSEAKAYCASLSLGGTSGWRVPGRLELLTIADHARAPALDPQIFPITPDGVTFWTALAADTAGSHFEVSFALGTHAIRDDTTYDRVRCVRGARCVPKTRFAVLDSGWVLDEVTGLTWQQQISQVERTWAESLSYCSTVGQNSRLPTVKELVSLLNLGAASPVTTAFPDTLTAAKAAFWASTPYVISPGAAWMVGNTGSTIEDTSFHFRAWCVRQGLP